ncbi:protein jag [Phoenicibacter congonensis]|uniref:Jag family protein n=1 Tax=Phoenicibacter congonensis TaxID=1944646 RepID=UPI0009A6AA20|nr:R3H domain-containing nucleic acid-binding protein [Phoenicibacter congonensis]
MEFKTEVSDEELDKIADTSIETLREIAQFFELGEIEVSEFEGDEGELILDLDGEDLSVLIGHHGSTIQSFQQMVSLITSIKLGYKYPVTIDVHGYKSRQKNKLEDLAYKMANKALNQNRKVNLRPMSPYDRRIIHMVLSDEQDVETYSVGEGKDRHVVIKPIQH